MIILLPLEPLEQRYTEQWQRWWPDQLHKDGTKFKTICGEKLTDRINVGSVLDAYGTSYWKITQLARLVSQMQNGEITNNDVLLFADLWFPGIEALQYIACLGGQRPKITGILHAGTYDPNDFTVRQGMRPWGHDLEEAWLKFVDSVFVATQYHKDLILRSHQVDPDKIAVTGIPFYPDEFTEPRKPILKDTKLVVFPHRLDSEKHPEEFDGLARMFPEFRFVKTAEVCKDKSEYYDLLAKASVAISFATQETFGYAMLEATALGCYPLVPDRLSYKEVFPEQFRFKTFVELIGKLNSERKDEEVRDTARTQREAYGKSITNMTEVLQDRFSIR